MHVEDASENHDATANGQELEESHSLDVFLSSPSARCSTNDRSSANERNEALPRCNSLAEMVPNRRKLCDQLNVHVVYLVLLQFLVQSMSANAATETDERLPITVDDSGRKNLISQDFLIPRKQRRRRHENTEKNMMAPVPLSETTEGTTPLIEPQSETSTDLQEECDSFKIKVHPTQYRHVRMLTDLAEMDCPLVQASDQKQRVYPEIEVDRSILMKIARNK